MTSNFDTHNPIRPSFSILIFFRPLLPFVEKIGTPAFRSWIVDHFPSERLRLIKNISDTIHSESIEILRDKRTAIQSGDQAMIDKVGEGKDIMSILCKLLQLHATRILTSQYFVVRENMKASEADRLPEAQVIGQMSYALQPRMIIALSVS